MHELMHSIMQYNLPDGMATNRGQQFPMWFIEGTAQAAGGGFTANWNEWIRDPRVGMQFGVWDGEEVVRKWGLDDPQMGEYAQGYLATLYLGHLAAGGSGTANASTIASGLNKIFSELASGKTFDEALMNTTGLNRAGIEAMFGPTATANSINIRKLGSFVDDLGTVVTLDGAGSIVADGGLSAEPLNVINSTQITTSPIYIGKVNLGSGVIDLYDPTQNTPPTGWVNPNTTPSGPVNPPVLTPGGGGVSSSGDEIIRLHVGAGSNVVIELRQPVMSTQYLGLQGMSIATSHEAEQVIGGIGQAINKVSEVRSYLGATQNRLEHTISNLENVIENTTAAESRIRDTDMAEEMTLYVKNQILLQVTHSMLAQANQASQSVIQLLQ